MTRNKYSQSPKKVLLLGWGISRSISPQIQNRAFNELGMNVEYSPVNLMDEEFIAMMRKISKSKDILGFNITVPFKVKVIKYLTKMDPRSKIIGAVNTVNIPNKGLMQGFNTDHNGVEATLKELKLSQGSKEKSAVILGAGGAARACAYTLAKNGFSSILVLNRTMKRANSLATHFRSHFPKTNIKAIELSTSNLAEVSRECDLLINAISSSTKNYFPVKIDFKMANARMKFFDLGYKEESLLLRTALNFGIRAIDGVLMLVEQAASSFEIWTGQTAPRKEMMTAAREALDAK